MRSFVIYKNAVEKRSDSIKCLALCHGHNHTNKELQKIKGMCYWYFADINPDCCPDYVCDVTSEKDMSVFPNDYFDVVMLLYYSGDKTMFDTILMHMKRIVKPNGRVFLHGIQKLLYHFYNEEQNSQLHQNLQEIMGYEEFDQFVMYGNYTQKYGVFLGILHNYYKGIYKKEVRDYINGKGMESLTTKLSIYGFTIQLYNDRYIVVSK